MAAKKKANKKPATLRDLPAKAAPKAGVAAIAGPPGQAALRDPLVFNGVAY